MSKVEENKENNQSENKDKKIEKSERKHKEKKEKREGEPKKPTTAFFLFCADKRAENKDKKLTAKELGELFKNLSEDKKEEYKNLINFVISKFYINTSVKIKNSAGTCYC